MPIPEKFRDRFIYHFTEADNIESILRDGLRCKSLLDETATPYLSIAEESIQKRRSEKYVADTGNIVHDYVPLYFGSTSPMLLSKIKQKNVDQPMVVYFEFPIDLIGESGVYFTNISANSLQEPSYYNDPRDLEKLNWDLIDSTKWSTPEGQKPYRMAEVLYPNILSLERAKVVVWNKGMKSFIQNLIKELKIEFELDIIYEVYERKHYFMKFLDPKRKNLSLVAGPKTIQADLEIYLLKAEADNKRDYEFDNIRDVITEIDDESCNIESINKLKGLQPAYGYNKNADVFDHSRMVVENLKKDPDFLSQDEGTQALLEFVAWVHDVGKSEIHVDKESGRHIEDADHNLYGLPIVWNIIYSVKSISVEDKKLILKLVCYSDIIGEIIGKNRHPAPLFENFSESEFQLLKIISKSDILATNESWYSELDFTLLESKFMDYKQKMEQEGDKASQW